MKLTSQRFLLVFLSTFLRFTTILVASNETESVAAVPVEGPGRHDGARAIYSPQLEYTEWVPMGRGDPLKNDPTYDYSPPKTGPVKYWADGTGHKDKSKDILILGVSSQQQQRPKENFSKHGSARRNFAYSDLPTMLIPPPHETPSAPVESYQMPTWNSNSRRGVIEPFLDARTYSTIYRDHRPIGPTTYTHTSRYKLPPPNFIDPYHKRYFGYKPPKEQFFGESQRFPTFSLPAPFTKPAVETTTTYTPEIVDAQSINYEFSYQTTVPTTTTTTTTTTKKPLPPPPSTTDATTTTSTTSMYARFERPTKSRTHMSLVIEGHSNVKTYGNYEDPKEKHKPKIVPVHGHADPIIRKVTSKDENGHDMEIKHLHTPPNPKKETTKIVGTDDKKKDVSTMDSLLSFFDASFGGFLNSKDDSAENSSEEVDGEQNGLTHEKEVFRKVRQSEPYFYKKH